MTDWGSFPDTVLHFRTNPPFVVDLRKAISAESISRLRSAGFEQSFGVITAENPMGIQQSASTNSVRTAALRDEVAKLQVPRVDLDACSPDRSHCEDSIAAEIALAPLIAVANHYEQLAVFWFDGDVFWIEPVLSAHARLRLPVLT